MDNKLTKSATLLPHQFSITVNDIDEPILEIMDGDKPVLIGVYILQLQRQDFRRVTFIYGHTATQLAGGGIN